MGRGRQRDPLYPAAEILVALRPTTFSVTAHARMAATLERLSSGRLLVNVVVSGDACDLEGDGRKSEDRRRPAHP